MMRATACLPGMRATCRARRFALLYLTTSTMRSASYSSESVGMSTTVAPHFSTRQASTPPRRSISFTVGMYFGGKTAVLVGLVTIPMLANSFRRMGSTRTLLAVVLVRSRFERSEVRSKSFQPPPLGQEEHCRAPGFSLLCSARRLYFPALP